jgi:hypothetical protein
MCKFDNYVYLTICEVSIEDFKKTNWNTYVVYCKNIYLAIKTNTLSNKETKDIEKMMGIIDKIYSMGSVLTYKYVVDYFGKADHHRFYKVVTLTQDCFSSYLRDKWV